LGGSTGKLELVAGASCFSNPGVGSGGATDGKLDVFWRMIFYQRTYLFSKGNSLEMDAAK